MRPLLAAMRFLTILPMPRSWGVEEKHLAHSVPYFPLVGVLIGAGIAGLDFMLGYILPRSVSSVITVMALTAMSGGLHLDGLADSADALLSGRSPERMLEIMKDSRSGPMGVAAIVFVLVLKITALAEVSGSLRPWLIALMPVAGRSALVVSMTLIPRAKPKSSLSSVFRTRLSHCLPAIIIPLALGWTAFGGPGVVVASLGLASALYFSAQTFTKIGGITGDTLGAACEIAETMTALAAVAWLQVAMWA